MIQFQTFIFERKGYHFRNSNYSQNKSFVSIIYLPDNILKDIDDILRGYLWNKKYQELKWKLSEIVDRWSKNTR